MLLPGIVRLHWLLQRSQPRPGAGTLPRGGELSELAGAARVVSGAWRVGSSSWAASVSGAACARPGKEQQSSTTRPRSRIRQKSIEQSDELCHVWDSFESQCDTWPSPRAGPLRSSRLGGPMCLGVTKAGANSACLSGGWFRALHATLGQRPVRRSQLCASVPRAGV